MFHNLNYDNKSEAFSFLNSVIPSGITPPISYLATKSGGLPEFTYVFAAYGPEYVGRPSNVMSMITYNHLSDLFIESDSILTIKNKPCNMFKRVTTLGL